MGDWRRDLRRRIGVLLAIKLVALILIKTFFFSGDARMQPTPDHLHEQLALGQTPAAREPAHD
jgi:hypothetical protein